jgi:hypothetical protein
MRANGRTLVGPAIVAIAGAAWTAACGAAPSSGLRCQPLGPGQYAFHLSYLGESTADGGCPTSHVLDGQTVHLVFDEHGAITLTLAAGTVSCWSGGGSTFNEHVTCAVPPSDLVRIDLSTPCEGLPASAFEFDDLSGVDLSATGPPMAACTESYSAERQP